MHNGEPKKKVYIDEELFERIQGGDKDAFKKLYETSYKPLYAFLLSLTQNSEDAKDLMQDTYLQIYQKSHLYKQEGNPMAWIMKIAKNLFLMKYRKEKEKQFVCYDDMENELGFAKLGDIENKILLETMFSELSAEDREIIVMHDVAGLKFKEIAVALQKPMGTVLARYNRNIRKLQKKYSKEVTR
ncbi:MAG: RNA polymerase sigma factor [Eubacterium sp.]